MRRATEHMQNLRMWHAVTPECDRQYAEYFRIGMYLSASQLWWCNKVLETVKLRKGVLGPGFRGLSPWLTGSIALGPVKKGTNIRAWSMWCCKVAHFRVARKQERCGAGADGHGPSIFMQSVYQGSMLSFLCASVFIYWTHSVRQVQGQEFSKYCFVVVLKLCGIVILFHFRVERNSVKRR